MPRLAPFLLFLIVAGCRETPTSTSTSTSTATATATATSTPTPTPTATPIADAAAKLLPALPRRSGQRRVAVHRDTVCAAIPGGGWHCFLGGAPFGAAVFLRPSDEMAVSASHVCSVKAGAVACVARNADAGAEVHVDALQGVEQIAARGRTTCALRSDATVVCWGADLKPIDTKLASPTSIAVASGRACTRTLDASPACWGSRALEIPAAELLAWRDAAGLSVSETSICLWRGAGGPACWGEGIAKADAGTAVTSPVRAVAILDAKSGGCVLGGDARVRCGRLPNPTALVKVEDEPLDDVVDISADDAANVCAVTATGQVWCWTPGATPHRVDG